jgi:hypothetical protein
MPMMYKQRVCSRRYDSYSAYMFRDKNEMDMRFNPRNLLLEFLQYDGVNWFVENGIPLSVETHEVPKTMEMQADLFASFTAEQHNQWREKKIIDKLQNSYNNKQDKTDYPF